ncbi:MAG: sulfotransferase family protein [Bacteroidota bacterium]
MKPLRICLWSGPRHVSSAVMYAFAQRDDTTILDEPLYGHYLSRTGVKHPGRDLVLKEVETRPEVVIQRQILGDSSAPVMFIKNMAHHMVGVDLGFLDSLVHVFLIRNPREMIPSLLEILPQPNILDTAYKMEYKLFSYLQDKGINPLVVEAKNLCNSPERTLRSMCTFCGIPFQKSMLHWQSGPLSNESVWGDIWYNRVRETTGFQPYQAKMRPPIPDQIEELIEESYSYYLPLYEKSLTQGIGSPAAGGLDVQAMAAS